MEDRIAVWREALRDASHPRHQVAWLLFTGAFNAEFAGRRLAEQKEAVLPYLFQILDTPQLYSSDSLGEGYAPIHAIELLGHWQVVEAVPRLLRILEEEEEDAIARDEATEALASMGPSIRERMLDYAEKANPALYHSLAYILSKVAKGDPRVFAWVRARLDEAQSEWEIRLMAENLLNLDPEPAIALLEERIRRRRYNKRLSEILQRYIDNTRRTGSP